MATEKQVDALHWLINKRNALHGATIHVDRDRVAREIAGLNQEQINAAFAELNADIAGRVGGPSERQVAIGTDLEYKIGLLGGEVQPANWRGLTGREAFERIRYLIELKKELQVSSSSDVNAVGRAGSVDRP